MHINSDSYYYFGYLLTYFGYLLPGSWLSNYLLNQRKTDFPWEQLRFYYRGNTSPNFTNRIHECGHQIRGVTCVRVLSPHGKLITKALASAEASHNGERSSMCLRTVLWVETRSHDDEVDNQEQRLFVQWTVRRKL